MPKEFYQILEINENADQEEIKKAYRKLAQQWHPDKWTSKSFEEREKANEMMQKINRAYEILSDEEKKRRYDLGETDFSSYENDYRKSTWEEKEEKLKKQEELLEKLVKGTEEYMRILEALWLLNARYLDRDDTAADIDMIAIFGIPKVFDKDLEPKFSYLWEPYKSWRDKVWKMPITLSMKDNIDKSEELKNFKAQMIKAIEETRIILQNKQRTEEKEEIDSRIKKARAEEIGEIEELLKRKGIKVQDLEEEYRNYREQINNLNELWKIHDLRDDVIENIWKLVKAGKVGSSENNSSSFEDQSEKQDKGQIPSKSSDNNQKKVNYNDLTRQELVNTINQKDLENSSLKEITAALEKKIKELEEEIQELKSEEQTPEIQQQIQKRENYLQEARSSLEKIISLNTGKSEGNTGNKSKNDNNSPTGWIIGGGVLAVVGFIVLFIIRNRKKKKISH